MSAVDPSARPVVLQRWHDLVAAPDPERLRRMLAPDVVFHSPAVHTPQAGVARTHAYLWAAIRVLGPTLRYHHEWWDESSGVLRFTAAVNGFDLEGVDLVRWDERGRIDAFTVMIRPFKGLEALVVAMGAQLQAQPGR